MVDKAAGGVARISDNEERSTHCTPPRQKNKYDSTLNEGEMGVGHATTWGWRRKPTRMRSGKSFAAAIWDNRPVIKDILRGKNCSLLTARVNERHKMWTTRNVGERAAAAAKGTN